MIVFLVLMRKNLPIIVLTIEVYFEILIPFLFDISLLLLIIFYNYYLLH